MCSGRRVYAESTAAASRVQCGGQSFPDRGSRSCAPDSDHRVKQTAVGSQAKIRSTMALTRSPNGSGHPAPDARPRHRTRRSRGELLLLLAEVAVFVEEGAVAEADGAFAGVEVVVQGFAAQHGLAEAGRAGFGVADDVVRDEGDEGVGGAGAAAVAGAAVVELDAGGFEFGAGEGPGGVDDPERGPAVIEEQGGDVGVAPPAPDQGRASGRPVPPRAGGAPGCPSRVRALMTALAWTGTLPLVPPKPVLR